MERRIRLEEERKSESGREKITKTCALMVMEENELRKNKREGKRNETEGKNT